ncbi:hypothetical protein LCD36_08675 [Saccharopolyspora sp. 6T]|uniref:hypothetical protein n=1 Tax=Saccharopolyspora sp. 6T TaxID=2877238 RepID=UPI001CD55E94|nr:hypothetical protein [Saccharopolyspora sp. 6T]MCA1186514.1 hypothetical protein [Saccharopolyspora sp. 6T]
MTGSWRRRWPLLRAWTARAAATAGLVGGAWLLAAGPAEAAPQPDVVPAVRVEVAKPTISSPAAVRPAIARPDPVEITAPNAPEPVHEDVPTDAVQLGVADLAADITSGVRAELEPVVEPAEPDRAEPDLVQLLPDRGGTGAVATTAPPPDVATPRAQVPERVEPAPPVRTEAPDTAQHLSAPAPEPQHQAAPTPAPVEHGGTAPHQGPPVGPPAVVTASAAPSGSGHGLRWMHAVLPARPHLPGPVRAVGGHVETVISRGIALIEPSTSPD